jgi:hypothetical protein
MSTPQDSEMPARHPERDPHAVDLSRRKLGMGLGVSSIFTLASRPVLAAQCMSASAQVSGNLSSHGPALICNGLTPDQWVLLAQNTNHSDPNSPTQNGFPGGNVSFHAISLFESGSRANWGSGTRLYEVMGGGTAGSANPFAQGGALSSATEGDTGAATNTIATATGPNPISMEFAAALLNIRAGRIPDNVLNEPKLIGMWNEWLVAGTFAPMAGATWDTEQIVAYLRTLQGA